MPSSRARNGASPVPVFRRMCAGAVAALLVSPIPLVAKADTLGTLPASQAPSGPVPEASSPEASSPEASSPEAPVDSAPRSIVPPGFGATVPEAAPESAVGDGLEPAGRASGETLRSVPGQANTGITVGTLASVDASSTGLIGEDGGSLGADMWRGTARADVERHLGRLSVVTGSPVLNDLARRLLLTGAQPPEGVNVGTSLLALRLDRLIAAGHADLAYELGRSALADKSQDVAVARARAALAIGKDGEACAELPDIPMGHDPAHDATAAFALKLSAFCQTVSGNKATANLTLDLAREEGLDDPLFYSLVAEATDGLKLKAADPASLEILDAALYRLAGRPLPANAGEIAVPAIVPTLARDETLAPETRIAAGERAAMLGLLASDELAALYRLPPFTQADFDGLATGVYPDAPTLRRALLFQAIDAEISPVERARLIALMLATGESSGLYLVTVEALMPTLTGLMPSPVLRTLAPAAVRAFLLVGERDRAEAWFGLVAPEAGGTTIGRDARELSALMRIGDAEGPGGNSEQISADILADLRSGVSATRNFATLETLLLQARGYPLPQNVLAAVTAIAPDSLLSQLAAAGRKGAVGEVVLLSLLAIGPGGPEGVDPHVIAQAVSSLGAVHLDGEARRLATEALMGHSHAEPG